MFEDRTRENLTQEFLEKIDLPLAKNEGSILYSYASASSLIRAGIYADMDELFKRAFLIDSVDDDIDKRAKEFGIERKQGTRTRGYVRVEGDNDTVIPDGLTISHAGNRYTILGEIEPMIIQNGERRCYAEAIENGKDYNIPAGVIFTIEDAVTGINRITNEDIWDNGTDIESDQDFKERFFYLRRHKGTSGNVDDYINWGLSVDGVKHVKVVPRYNGAGSVKVVIMGEKNRNVETEVLENAKKLIESKRPLTVKDLKIVTPTPVPINISATVESDVTDLEFIKSSLSNLVSDYLLNSTNEITYTKIAGILSSIDDVIDYKDLTVNGSTANIKLQDEQIGSVGEITLSKGVVD